MIIQGISEAFHQAGDKRFRKVFLLGISISTIVLAGLIAGMTMIWPETVNYSDWDWVNDFLGWIIGWSIWPSYILAGWFLFPAISTIAMGLFLDDVVDAVEDEHYPDHKSPRRPNVPEAVGMAARMAFLLIFMNILAIPFYILLLFTGIGPFVLYLLLNSYLLGREYFELVAARHFTQEDARRYRRLHRDKAFLGGAIITGMYVVPILNLFAPIMGIAMMTHVFHNSVPEHIKDRPDRRPDSPENENA